MLFYYGVEGANEGNNECMERPGWISPSSMETVASLLMLS